MKATWNANGIANACAIARQRRRWRRQRRAHRVANRIAHHSARAQPNGAPHIVANGIPDARTRTAAFRSANARAEQHRIPEQSAVASSVAGAVARVLRDAHSRR